MQLNREGRAKLPAGAYLGKATEQVREKASRKLVWSRPAPPANGGPPGHFFEFANAVERNKTII